MPVGRILLLALLPVIGLGIYLEGQHYDPAVIRFDEAQPGAGDAVSLLPGEMGEFVRLGPIRSYTKDNLYEYINGHAEYFITAGFAGLNVGEYGRSGTETKTAAVVVDVYDMGTGLQAFGVFWEEAGDAATLVDIGTTASRTSQGINFHKGRYYVKIAAFDESASVEDFARRIQEGIAEDPEALALFSRFPDLGDIAATRFVRHAYRGLDFVANVLEREYTVDAGRVQVFLVAGSEEEIGRYVAAFKKYFHDGEIPYREEVRAGTLLYRIDDPYEGKWLLLPFPRTIYGVFGPLGDEYLDRLIEKGRSGGRA